MNICIKCGDGKVQGAEVCDDGGKGGCLPNCSGSSPGYSCVLSGLTSVCSVVCGDGLVIPPETCDDNGYGGCNSTCNGMNDDFICNGGGSPSSATSCSCITGFHYLISNKTCYPTCGDGLVINPEICDDHNVGGCKDCSGSNPLFNCSIGSLSTPSICTCVSGYSLSKSYTCITFCGDGFLAGYEECDDGSYGGCLSDCSGPSIGFNCTGGNLTSQTICVLYPMNTTSYIKGI